MPDLSGTVLDGKYELIRLLGEGGMGTVYEAEHRLIGRRLAVKFLHSQYVSSEEVLTRFQREAQAAAAVGHENIIEVTDMGQTPDGAPYLVMEYLDGLDVRRLLADAGILSAEQAAHIMSQALSALQAAHDAGIIHRDLKPENIYLIEKSGQRDYVKLLDFGISKFKSLEGEDAKGLTQTGTVLGTPYYMSPEQARGDQNIGPKSDIYAMGVILFQMMTGRLPFDAPNYNALLIKILTEEPVDPLSLNPELPLDIAETIKTAMARSPDDRFEDCTDFRRRLLGYVPGASSSFHSQMTSASKSAMRAALSSTATPLDMTKSGAVGAVSSKRRLPAIIAAASVSAAAAAVALYFVLANPSEDKVAAPASLPDVSITATRPEAATQTKEESLKKSPAPAAVSPAASDLTEKAASPEEKPASEVSIKLSAHPKSARISIDGVLTDGNSYESKVSKDDALHKVEITAEGFEPISADIRFDRDQNLVYTLSKAKKEDAPRSRKSRKSTNRKKGSSKEASVPEKVETPEPRPSPPRRRIDDEDPWK